jgi:molybdopterin-containing oxidoreductase family membrane subunit
MIWYGNGYEQFLTRSRTGGPYGLAYLALLLTNILIPQSLWSKRIRLSPAILFLVALSVNIGMWLERYVIVVTSLHRDYMISLWGRYSATRWDWTTFIGTIGLFLTLFFLFIRLLPVISTFEMRTLLPEAEVQEEGGEKKE